MRMVLEDPTVYHARVSEFLTEGGKICKQLTKPPGVRWAPGSRPAGCGNCYECTADEGNYKCSGFPGENVDITESDLIHLVVID